MRRLDAAWSCDWIDDVVARHHFGCWVLFQVGWLSSSRIAAPFRWQLSAWFQ